jgi:antitoxin VapB
MDIARLFRFGRSHAVLIPEAIRFEGDVVRITRPGAAVVAEPTATDWRGLHTIVGPIDDDFAHAVLDRPADQARPALDVFS